jgi:hypothetical protein
MVDHLEIREYSLDRDGSGRDACFPYAGAAQRLVEERGGIVV